VADGNPVLGANYTLYRALLDDWGGTRAVFVRVLLLALSDLAVRGGNATFADYAGALLDRLAAEGLADPLEAAAAILDAHGLRGTDREVDLTGAAAADGRYLALDCAVEEPWNTWMVADLGDGPVPLATAYLRHRVTAASGATAITISARLAEKPWGMTAPGDWDYRMLVRSGGPIAYGFDGDGVATPNHEALLAPVITPGEGGAPDLATWTIDGLEPGATVHLQFVNLGLSEGILGGMAVE